MGVMFVTRHNSGARSLWAGLLLAVSPAVAGQMALLDEAYQLSRPMAVGDRIQLLHAMAKAAEKADSASSRTWALEMYEIATRDLGRGIARDASRKNAVTVLAANDPMRAAELLAALDPPTAHLPNEDPRVDAARAVIPAVSAKQGLAALPLIEKLARDLGASGQFPYQAVGEILPGVATKQRPAARRMFLEAVAALPRYRHIWRANADFVEFLRLTWSHVDRSDLKVAVEAGLTAAAAGNDPPKPPLLREIQGKTQVYSLNSDGEFQVYRLLPYADRARRGWSRRLRRQHPALLPLPDLRPGETIWSVGVAAVWSNEPARIRQAFDRGYLMWLPQWAPSDPTRALRIANAVADPARRDIALARVLPALFPSNRPEAENLWRQLGARILNRRPETPEALDLAVSLAQAGFALGRRREAGDLLLAALDPALDQYSRNGVPDAYSSIASLAAGYGVPGLLERIRAASPDRVKAWGLVQFATGLAQKN